MERSLVSSGHFFKGSFAGLILSGAILTGVYFSIDSLCTDGGQLFGVSTAAWTGILFAAVLIHQFVVWLVWRLQLCFRLFTRLFGKIDLLIWSLIFFPLIATRPVLSIFIGISDFGSLPGPRVGHLIIGVLLLIPALYAGDSVLRHFGVIRAVGADHFRESYKTGPLVTKGMYRWSNNVMYVFVFLLFWAIGFLTSSKMALVSALFQHALVWVHWYSVEAPDMIVIYED